jgi:hypothetical protein
MPPALPFSYSGATSPGMIVSGRTILLGYSMAETAGAVAVFNIFDGGTGGTKIARVNLNANESTREWMGPMGIAFEQGLFISRVSGTVDVCVYCVPEDRLAEGVYGYTESTG